MGAVYNQGPRTWPVARATGSVAEYMLVDYRDDGTVREYVQGSGEICQGSAVTADIHGDVPILGVTAEGTRYLKLDNGETIADAGFFTHGDTAGTIKPVAAGDPILGYVVGLEGGTVTSGAATYAIVECVLLPYAGVADAVTNGGLTNWPVGPVVAST